MSVLKPSSALRTYLPLLALFVASRAILAALGLRMALDLSWMFLSDFNDLREHLLRTVFYFHAFAPGMNLLTGLLAKLSPEHILLSATAVFWAAGFVLTASAFRTFQLIGCSTWVARSLALSFSLLPQSLYLEHLYLYTYLCASLLCLAGVLLHHAIARPSRRAWFLFFLVCASLGWLYTAFHLFWLVLVVLVALLIVGRGKRSAVVRGAALPFAMLFGLYLKNYAVFGVFNATSWGGANVTLATVSRLTRIERSILVREGKLSPYANVSVFEGPSKYLPLLPAEEHFPWPGSNELIRPSVDAPNFNHGLFLEVNRTRQKDAGYYLKTRWRDYVRTVLFDNLPQLFGSTTHWHPLDRKQNSPHNGHRKLLGRYEAFYDRCVHEWPWQPYGLYVFLPPFMLWACVRGWVLLASSQLSERARGALLVFCVSQSAFVVAASSMFSSLESARYRFTVEPCIWAVVAYGLCCVWRAAWPVPRAWVSQRMRYRNVSVRSP